jgi:hypothetical protein
MESYFYTVYKKYIFLAKLCKYIEFLDVHQNLFFINFKYFEIYSSGSGEYIPRAKMYIRQWSST